jgi:hypothetical protein
MARAATKQQAEEPAKNLPANAPAASGLMEVPEWMRADAGAGLEGLSSDDFEIPRLKLLQGLSSEVKERDDTRAGWFFHTAAEVCFKEPFRAVPIFVDRRFILWRPLEDNGGGILARADDGVHWKPANATFDVKLDKKDGGHRVQWKTAPTVKESGLAEWGSHNPKDETSGPAATRMLNYVLAFPDFPDLPPAVFTFQRTSFRNGKELNSKMLVAAGRTAIYGMVFMFNAYKDTNKTGQDFFNCQARADGLVTDKALYERYRELHRQFSETGIQIKDMDSLGGEDAGSESPEDRKGSPEI